MCNKIFMYLKSSIFPGDAFSVTLPKNNLKHIELDSLAPEKFVRKDIIFHLEIG